MPKQVRLRRGTTAQHAVFAGALGEVTFDTDKSTLVCHDGVTPGGRPLGGEVLPEGRTTEEEEKLIGRQRAATHSAVRGGSSSRSPASSDAARGGTEDFA